MRSLKKFFLIIGCLGVVCSAVAQAKGIPTVNKQLKPGEPGASLLFYNFQMQPQQTYTVVCNVRNLSKTDKATLTWGTFGSASLKHKYIDGIEQDYFTQMSLNPEGTKDNAHVVAVTGLLANSEPTQAIFSVQNWSEVAIIDATCTMMAE